MQNKGFLESYFELKEKGTNVRTEIVAGVTTFMTMAYILFVNPNILKAAGMDFGAVMMATAISAGITTIIMGLYAKLPFALAPGMGLNAYFAFTVVLGMKIPWQVALGAVFLDGLIFLILSILPIRERIVREIPMNIKLAVSVAIGLFIAFIGLSEGGLVVASEATKVTLGKVTSPGVILVLVGLFITGLLMAKKVKGALLWGIVINTILGMFIKVPGPNNTMVTITKIPHSLSDLVAAPDFSVLGKTFLQMDVAGAIGLGIMTVVFTFTFVDMFDTVGTLIGLSSKLGIIDKTGSFKGAGKGLVTDAIGTMLGAVLGTSTVTTYVESAAGVGEGGRSGLTAVVTGILFLLALFLWPLAGIIPPQATAPALIIVGFLMMSPVLKLDLEDITEALPAFLAIIMMPLTYSIADGLIFGILSYTILKLITGRGKEVSVTMWILSVLFLINFYMSK